jgi:hypothetical protein
VPIFGHCYDFAIPNGRHPPCTGPWLRPSLDFTGWTDASAGAATVRRTLELFKAMVAALAADPANLFVLVDTQGVLLPEDWANELHPHPAGFIKEANKFPAALRSQFPGRI